MALADGIARVMESRGVTVRDVLARVGDQRDRATVYRLLAGNTVNPRLDTLLSLCNALGTTPNELLDQSEVLTQRPRSADEFDLRLRKAFTRVQTLPIEIKAAAVAQVLLLAETWERLAAGRSMDDLFDAYTRSVEPLPGQRLAAQTLPGRDGAAERGATAVAPPLDGPLALDGSLMLDGPLALDTPA